MHTTRSAHATLIYCLQLHDLQLEIHFIQAPTINLAARCVLMYAASYKAEGFAYSASGVISKLYIQVVFFFEWNVGIVAMTRAGPTSESFV